ncbi:DNA-binding domain-containing protein [Ralstonia soli]|uniref:DNA-binding domain-containing protein n=1 Tax=Ralstonia soli TaxID=2953896 RepID=A0ABT1ATA6_9RALS|nr:DNA-binding domain-containing protein [Ralstonia soli]MCO5401625.1 DNA-binding domain-containing protein [Ralstonia soli]
MRLPDWEAHLIHALTTAAPGDEARGVAVYRNARLVILRNALAAAYPVCRTLVGEDCFDALVRDTLAVQTSTSPNLHRYGDALPTVIAQSPLADSVPYLADVARLEWCVHWAHYAPDADVEALNTGTLGDMLARPADAIRAGLVDSARCVASSWPVASIWRAHQPGADLSLNQIDLGVAEAAVVTVRGNHVAVLDLDAPTAVFLAACEATPSLQAALETTLAQRADFDLTACLAGLYRAGLLALSACPAFHITHPGDMS